MAESALNHDDYIVAWICPIEVEQIPAILMLDTEHDPLPQSPNDHNVYTLGSINGHNIVVASLPTAGNCSAATVITQMRNTFQNLRFCLLVGIGGGVPTTTDQGPLRLGHVIVSKPSGTESGVIQCDHGKVEADGQLHRTGVLSPPPPVLLNSAQQMSVKRRIAREDSLIKHLQRIDTSPEMMPEYGYPGREKDPLYDREIQGTRKRRFEVMDDDGCPKWIVVHRGTIATSEKVVKNAGWRERLSKAFGAICFEMEAAGALVDFPCLVVRGVSDYADESKNDDWQPYAAACAAAYARELFFHMPVDQVKQCSIPEKYVKQMIQDTSGLSQSDQDRKIEMWLAPPNPSTNHNAAKERHLEGTGQWFLESTEFLVWKASVESALWVHGIPGCGKTILSSTTIQHLQSTTEGTSLAYFFFDFSDTNKQSFEKMVRSLIFQLSSLSAVAKRQLTKLYRDCRDGQNQPDIESLHNTFQAMSKELPYLIILLDALDECEYVSRKSLMNWLGALDCRTLMTSRKLEDIQSSIGEWERPVAIFNFQNSPVSKDIRTYIRQKLGRDVEHTVLKPSKSKLARKWKGYEGLLTEIETKLTEKADGMFRWASCQLEALEEYEMPNDLLNALDTLPDTLDETYRRILDGIPRIHLANSTRILQFLTYAKRPIKTIEAIDILATTPENDLKFDAGNRMPNPHGILKFCSSLVTMSEEGIQLAHFSVKEYLASSENKGAFARNLQESQAHESITKILLAYMSSLKNWEDWQDDMSSMIRLFPLVVYGAYYWMEHATISEKNQETRERILDFFEHREAFFICTSLIFTPEYDLDHSFYSKLDDSIPPLYLASMEGWQHIVKDLLSQSPDSINEVSSGWYGSALQVACHQNHVDVARILLKHGANVDLKSPAGPSPCTALMTALDGEHLDLVELLLEHNADPNLKATCLSTENGPDDLFPGMNASPLIRASLCRSEASARILLDKGALPNKTDDYGNSALYYACWRGNCKIANLLLDHGADIDGANFFGTTPFYAACVSGRDEIIRLLLERRRTRNTEVLVSGGKCGGALQTASYWGRLDTVKSLLSYGADPDQIEGDYGPALHAASSRGHLRVVEELLSRGADPYVLDCHQWTARCLATKNKHDDVSKALRLVSASRPPSRCIYPSTFIQLGKNQDFKIDVSKRTLERVSSELMDLPAWSNHPFDTTARHIYFQIKVISIGESFDTNFEVGFCCRELLSEIGTGSYDSRVRSCGMGRLSDFFMGDNSACWKLVPSLVQDDIIGCGVDYDSNISYYTLNGKLYGKPNSAPVGRLFAFLNTKEGTKVHYDFSAMPPDSVGSLGRQEYGFEQASRKRYQRFSKDELVVEQIEAHGRGGTHGQQERQDALSQAEGDEAVGEYGAGSGGVRARQAGEEAGEYDAALSAAPLGGEDDSEEERVEEQGFDDGLLARRPA